MTSSLRIVVTGLIAQYPLGGMTWHYLQYVLGLLRLGHDVYYVEDMGAAPYSPLHGGMTRDCRLNVEYLAGVMSRYGMSGRWAYSSPVGAEWFGLPDSDRRAVIRSADLLINVSGTLVRPEDYRQIRRLAYIDTDPVFNQISLARGRVAFREQVDAHDVHFSFGERLSETMPSAGYRWRPTRQPVVLTEWHPSAPRRNVFTTVMNWTARHKPVVHDGRTYGQKDVELIRFLGLPALVAPAQLEVAVHDGKGRRAPRALLAANGWRVVDPEAVCLDFDSYRTYIESSMAEWSVAKNGYVQNRPGWFSERSACYLAAGRPVVVQDTGFPAVLPVGEGLIAFTTIDEATSAIRDVEGNYARHATAARAIAEEYFDSYEVLGRLIEDAFESDGRPVVMADPSTTDGRPVRGTHRLAPTVPRSTTMRERSDPEEMCQCAERIVADVYGRGAAIAEFRQERSKLSTSYDTHILTARLTSGGELKIFLKDFGWSIRPKDDVRQRSERELHVYRDLLPGAGLGTASYYGSLRDASRGRFWLFLELVDGTPVGYCDFACWPQAVVGLGRLHGHFAAQPGRLMAHDFLIRYDAEFFWSKAEQATAAVTRVTPHLAERLARLVRRYGAAVDVMASQPPTLMHGGCGAKNILVNVSGDPSRVCILDWEEAGVGAPLCDVAWLLDGVRPPVLDRLLDAYRQEALACGLSLPAREDTDHVLDCFRLHRAMNWMSRAVQNGYQETDVAKLIAIAEHVGRRVLGRPLRELPGGAPSRVGGTESAATTGQASTPSSDATSLAAVLERMVRDAGAAPAHVTAVRREPSPFATLFPAEVIRASLASGERIALFLKHLGPEQSDHPEKRRRDREPRVYEELLTGRDLPVARYYGSRFISEGTRCELFLEYIDDWNLKCHGLPEWFLAARRLGELHAYFAVRAERLSACDFLLRLDAAYFHEWAARACAAAERRSTELALRVRDIAGDYERVARLLAGQPKTLVHNDLAPKNVIADRSTSPSRICFVDWEMAGIGCGLLDLATLKYGLPPAADQQMRAAYCEAVAGVGLLPSDPQDVERLFNACELHKTLYRVAFSEAWGVPAGRVELWVSEARQLSARV